MSSPPDSAETDTSYVMTLVIILNTASIISSIYALFTYTIFRVYYKCVVDRVSVRLSVAQSALDLAYSAIQLWSDLSDATEPGCSLSVLLYVFFSLYSLFLFAAISFNLHFIFLCKNFHHKRLEISYYVAGFLVAAAISTAGYLLGSFGWDIPQDTCWYRHEGIGMKGFIEQMLTLHVWTIITTLYSTFVVINVMQKIGQEKKMLNLVKSHESPSSNKPDIISTDVFNESNNNNRPFERRRKRQKELMRMLRRIALYPLIPFLTQWPNFFVGLLILVNKGEVAEGFLVWSFVGNCIQGIVNMIALMVDPAIITSRKLLLEDMKKEEALLFRFKPFQYLISFGLLFRPPPPPPPPSHSSIPLTAANSNNSVNLPLQVMNSKDSDFSDLDAFSPSEETGFNRYGGIERAEQYDLLSFVTNTAGTAMILSDELPAIDEDAAEASYMKNHQFFSKY